MKFAAAGFAGCSRLLRAALLVTLRACTLAAPEQLEKRLNDWYASVERYRLQLHELERDEYLDMKRQEIQRQQALGADAAAQ